MLGEVGRGNRKDVRNAVEAARKAQRGWAARAAHNRAPDPLLPGREPGRPARASSRPAWRRCPATADGRRGRGGGRRCARLFAYAAWADKWDGRVHATPFRNVTLAMNEPIGRHGRRLSRRVSLSWGSCRASRPWWPWATRWWPSRPAGPLAATDFYQVLDTSDVPGGVVNIVTGLHDEVVPTLAAHDDVDGSGTSAAPRARRTWSEASTGNMKRTWVSYGRARSWMDARSGQGEEFLREATQVKNIWVPYGE